MFGKGISVTGSLLDAALKYELIGKSGSWYSFGEERIGQGRENAKLFLESNPDTAAEIEEKLRQIMFKKDEPEEPAAKKTAAAAKKTEKAETAAAGDLF